MLFSVLVGCDRTVTAPVLDGAVSVDASRDAGGEASVDAAVDGGAGVMFHGVSVRSRDRGLPGVDAVGYELDLTVDDRTAGAETYAATMRGVFLATEAVDALALDFEGNTVDEVRAEGRVVASVREGAVLRVPLGRTVSPGEAFEVTVRYRGALFQTAGVDPNDFRAFGGLMAFARNRAGRPIVESLNWPTKARRWLPVVDHPRDGALVAVRATFAQRVTVLSNGRLEGTRDNPDGTRTWSYFCATPMPVYDLHVTAYDGWRETTATSAQGHAVRWLAYEGDADAGAVIFREVPDALDFYASQFGPFRWEQAGFVEAPIFGGGMEHATLVSMDETLFASPQRSRQVAFHELAHHWSGNLVRIATWNDFWLSEGFTDYLTGRFLTAHDPPASARAAWRSFLVNALSADLGASSHALRPADPEVDVLTIFDSIPYKKGAYVLRTLEHVVGTEAFTAFLRGWFDAHAGEAVTTQQFVDAAAAAFSAHDIAGFARTFVSARGAPVLTPSFVWNPTERTATVTLRQVQRVGPEGGFALPVVVELSDGTRTQRSTITLHGSSTVATVPIEFEPTRLTVDPDETAYLTTTCTADSQCHTGFTCGTLGREPARLCVPPRS